MGNGEYVDYKKIKTPSVHYELKDINYSLVINLDILERLVIFVFFI